MAEKIIKVKYFDGLAYRSYEIGKENVITIEIEGQLNIKVAIKDYEGKRSVFIKSEYIELFTKSR